MLNHNFLLYVYQNDSKFSCLIIVLIWKLTEIRIRRLYLESMLTVRKIHYSVQFKLCGEGVNQFSKIRETLSGRFKPIDVVWFFLKKFHWSNDKTWIGIVSSMSILASDHEQLINAIKTDILVDKTLNKDTNKYSESKLQISKWCSQVEFRERWRLPIWIIPWKYCLAIFEINEEKYWLS